MKKIGITGNIASGKSEIEKILTQFGYKVICADKITHGIFESDNEARTAILSRFSTLDRKKIAKIIFSDAAEKKALEKIMHPKIIKKIEELFAQNKHENLVFASVPLIYEMGIEKMFDGVILVASNDEARLKRLMERDNCTQEFAKLKMAAQMPQSEKIKLADFVIENNSDLKSLEKQVEKVIEHFSQI